MDAAKFYRILSFFALVSTLSFANESNKSEGLCVLESKCYGLKNVRNHLTFYTTFAVEKGEEIQHPKTKASRTKLESKQECFHLAVNKAALLEDLPKKFFDPPLHDFDQNRNESEDYAIACAAYIQWTFKNPTQTITGKVTGETNEVFMRLSESQIQLDIAGDHRYRNTDYPSKEWLVPLVKSTK